MDVSVHLYPSLIKLSTETFPWNKIDKLPTFTGILPHITILTMLEDIRTSQEGMADEVSENIAAELSMRGAFFCFSGNRVHPLL